jgi:hypothetical protein
MHAALRSMLALVCVLVCCTVCWATTVHWVVQVATVCRKQSLQGFACLAMTFTLLGCLICVHTCLSLQCGCASAQELCLTGASSFKDQFAACCVLCHSIPYMHVLTVFAVCCSCMSATGCSCGTPMCVGVCHSVSKVPIPLV